MQQAHRDRWLRRTGAGLSLAALLALAAATPAVAGSDEDVKGWIAAVDLALTRPAGLDEEYAFQSNISATPVQGTRLLLDPGSDSTFRLTGGYDFGLGLGKLEVSYWGFDGSQSTSDTLSGYVFPAVFGYGFYSSVAPSLTDARVEARSSVQASSIDVDYSRPVDAGENFTFRWLAGLRSVTFEEEVKFSGAGSYGGFDYNIQQKRHMNSDARGLKVGGRGVFRFTERFSMEGGVAVSLLRSDVKGDSSQSIAGTSTTVSERNRAEDNSGRGQILDLDLRGVWTEGPLSIYLGFSSSSWNGLVQDPNPPRSPSFPMTSGGGRDSVSFDSFDVGVIYRFGARRLAAP
jgi:major outer membrane protein